MKKFENKSTEITGVRKDNQPATYCDLIRVTLNLPPEGSGFSVQIMRSRFRILDVFEKAEKENEDTIEMEDADFELMRKTFCEFNLWTMMHKDIIKIDDYLKSIN